MARCAAGHYYDENRYGQCPTCGVDLNMGGMGPGDTQSYQTGGFPGGAGDLPPMGDPPSDVFPGIGGKTDSTIPPTDKTEPVTRPRRERGDRDERDPEATQRIVLKKMGIDPVVGWLVCIEGPEKGRDYRIKSHRNFIGRDNRMDICIPGDGMISRENHAIISYDPRSKNFLLIPDQGRQSSYVNDKLLVLPTELSAYDRIELGESKFAFIPFCGSNFHWEDDKDKAQQNEQKNR